MKRTMRRACQRGSAIIEFTLIGIPIIFILITTFEMARGMWLYHTVAHAVRDGSRFAIVHGNNCVLYGNTCNVTVADVARRIQYSGVGLVPADMQVRLQSNTRTIQGTLAELLADNTPWPTYANGVVPVDDGAHVGQPITVTGIYPFRSALVMFWPGVSGGGIIPAVNLPAISRQYIEF